MATIDKALEQANITLRKYDPLKARPVQTDDHTTLSITKFTNILIAGLKKEIANFPEVVACINNPEKMEKLLAEWAEENSSGSGLGVFIPEDLSDLTLS